MKRYFLILLVLYALPSLGNKDNDKKLSKKKLIEQADYYFFREDFPKALDLYNQLLHDYPKNHYVQYHAFVAFHLSSGRGTEMTALKEYEANEGVTDKFYNYWLGRIHYSRYEFELAEKHFQAFLDMDIYRTHEIKKESEDLLNQAQRAVAFHNNTNEFEIEQLPAPINSAYSDISPAFYSGHNELLFVSSRSQSTDSSQFKVFHSFKANDKFSAPKSITNLGSFEKSNAKIEIVNNDGRLFVYKNENGGDLYFSEPKYQGWSDLQKFNAPLHSQTIGSHFFINDSETIIYYAGKGNNDNLDIYQSTLDISTNTWSAPMPVAGAINSRYNDDNPFLSHDGRTLYFSSDRPESIGGYDVFKSQLDPSTGKWSRPINVGFPINTIDDEINFQLNEDNISGFFSSNRLHGKGEFDIYYFHKQGKVLASGKVYDQQTGEILPQAKLSFHPIKYQDEVFNVMTDNFGSYQVEIFEEENFIVEVFLENQRLATTQIQSSHDEHRKSFERNFHVSVPDEIAPETDFATLYQGQSTSAEKYEKLELIGNKFRSGEKAIVNNMYFDLHATTIQNESYPALEKIKTVMENNTHLVVEIGGHTCNIGSHETNMSVSLARAESVRSYLVTNGISANRLIAKGYGETRPLASNDDEEDGRELNRRIEIRVIQ
ncbi:MAG: OmpA family protein [Reichenbachiella sp.]|uniref:OmpA family protein n=1 Tax=Reichenbachiella sp. TaxID=2184521 RepID=UPI0032670B9E